MPFMSFDICRRNAILVFCLFLYAVGFLRLKPAFPYNNTAIAFTVKNDISQKQRPRNKKYQNAHHLVFFLRDLF